MHTGICRMKIMLLGAMSLAGAAPGFDVGAWRLPAEASWREAPGRGVTLCVVVPRDTQPGYHCAEMEVDLRPYAGERATLSCDARAEEVTRPRDEWNGVKCMLRLESPSQGKLYPGVRGFYGTRDWRGHAVTFDVPADATTGTLCLGLQDSTGTVWFDNVKLEAGGFPKRVKHPPPMTNPDPVDRGHPDVERLRGCMVAMTHDPEGLETLASWGANLIRFQLVRNWGKISDNRDLAEYRAWIRGGLDMLDKTLADCERLGIRVCVDVHVPPGGLDEDRNMAMFFEREYADAFVDVWCEIAARFKDRRALWAYDLINEPVQTRPSPDGLEDYWQLQRRVARAIREIDAETTVIFSVAAGGSPEGFRDVAPVDVPHVIYQVHMYDPHLYTHQYVTHAPDAPVAYPGSLNGQPIDKAFLRQKLQPVRDFQLAYNVPVYCGEFSAVRWAPGAERYLEDCIELFEEYGWDWSYHAFREWDGWSVEHNEDRSVNTLAEQPTTRQQVLRKWFDKN